MPLQGPADFDRSYSLRNRPADLGMSLSCDSTIADRVLHGLGTATIAVCSVGPATTCQKRPQEVVNRSSERRASPVNDRRAVSILMASSMRPKDRKISEVVNQAFDWPIRRWRNHWRLRVVLLRSPVQPGPFAESPRESMDSLPEMFEPYRALGQSVFRRS